MFPRNAEERKRSELRIIGAISRDLNRISNGRKPSDVDEEAQVVHKICKEFCSNSTVHGIRYLTEPKRHWLERIWWLVALTASVIMCSLVILSIWTKWNRHPVIVTFDDKTTSIGMIPFPAVTICSTQKFIQNKVDVNKFEAAMKTFLSNKEAFDNYSTTEINQLNAIVQTCLLIHIFDKNQKPPSSQSIFETIRNITLGQDSTIPLVLWLYQLDLDRKYFKPIFTAEGLCYTFNSINSRDIYADEVPSALITVRDNPNATHWSLEDGYQSNVNESDLYPYRVFGSGMRDSLIALLGISLEVSHKFCSKFAPGFRLSLHVSDDLPRLPNDFIHIPPEQDVYISIKPNVITTSNDLRSYPPNVRGCFFKSERQLRFFKSYSQQKCELECLANFTQEQCGCVQFSMPRDARAKICTMFDMLCYFVAESDFGRNFAVDECSCLPDCISISYHVEISQAQSKYFEEDSAQFDGIINSSTNANTKLFLSFKENQFISLNRSATSTMSDFISSCGGLLGLFMGVSMLSVIELIYYFTLRLCCKLRRRETFPIDGKTKWAKRNHLSMITNQYERQPNQLKFRN